MSKSRTIPPMLRKQVWEKHMKDSRSAYGLCYVCRKEIHILEFECGHVLSHVDGGSLDVENLRPICGSCNKSMGSKLLFDYIKEKFPAHYPLVEEDELIFRFRKLKVKEVSDETVSKLMKKKPQVIDLTDDDYEDNSSSSEQTCEHASCDKVPFKYGYCCSHIFKAFNMGLVKEEGLPVEDPVCQFILLKGKNRGYICGKPSQQHGHCKQHLHKVLE